VITVHVDRDSVAMGDDAVPHGVAWRFDDDATPGDVLLRVLSEHYLAAVAGAVAWGFELGRFAVDRGPGGLSLRSGESVTAAVVLQPLGEPWRVVPLRSRLLTGPFRSRPEWATANGYAARFRYSSAGAPLDAAALAGWLGRG